MSASGVPDGERVSVTEAGGKPKSRVQSAAGARAIHNRLLSAQSKRNLGFSRIKKLVDGHPPYDETKLVELGQAWRSNVNTLETRSQINAKASAYWQLLFESPSLIDVTFRKSDSSVAVVSPDLLHEWGAIVAEEATRMLRSWDQYFFNAILLTDQVQRYGVAAFYFPDKWTWRFRFARATRILVPERSGLSDEDLDFVEIRDTYDISSFFAVLHDPAGKIPDKEWRELTASLGWNPSAVKKAIVLLKTSRGTGEINDEAYLEGEYISAYQAYKNSSTGASETDFLGPNVVDQLVKEADGTITHHRIIENATLDEYLLEIRGKYPTMSSAFLPFYYNLGDGYFRSVKGLGHELVHWGELSNRLINSAHDAAFIHGSIWVRSNDDRSVDRVRLVRVGPVTMLIGAEMLPGNQIAQTQMQPLLDMRYVDSQVMNNAAGIYRMRAEALEGSGPEKTAQQVRSEEMHEAKFDRPMLTLYYLQWDRLYRELMRRVLDDVPEGTAGKKEAEAFVEACTNRGVPKDLLDADKMIVRASRSLGYGSPAMQDIATRSLVELIPVLKEERGRLNVIRDRIASIAGQDLVDRYVSVRNRENLPTSDHSLAMLENDAMARGAPVLVGDDQNHATHAMVHTMPMVEVVRQMNAGNMQFNLQAEVIRFPAAIAHTREHVALLARDPTRAGVVKQYTEMLKGLEPVGAKLAEQLQMAQQAQMQMQEQSQKEAVARQEAERAMDPRLVEVERKAQVKSADAQNQMAIRSAKAEQAMRIKDEQHEADMHRQAQGEMA